MSVNFAMFCAKSALGISWQHLSHPKWLVRNVYIFHVDFHIRLILHDLGISLPNEYGFSKVTDAYIKIAYYITVSAMTIALMRMKHGSTGTSFIRTVMVFLAFAVKATKDIHQTILHDA